MWWIDVCIPVNERFNWREAEFLLHVVSLIPGLLFSKDIKNSHIVSLVWRSTIEMAQKPARHSGRDIQWLLMGCEGKVVRRGTRLLSSARDNLTPSWSADSTLTHVAFYRDLLDLRVRLCLQSALRVPELGSLTRGKCCLISRLQKIPNYQLNWAGRNCSLKSPLPL